MYKEYIKAIDEKNYNKALEIAKKLDKGIGYFTHYVIVQQIIDEIKKDEILQEYYEFKKGR